MTAVPDLDVLDDDVIDASYDRGSLARGRAYAEEDRIRLLGSGPGVLKAVCRGSGRSSYLVKVRWRERDGAVDLDDSCTCPLGGKCKHCVAAILTARHRTAPRSSGGAASGGADWRRALAGLAGDGDAPEQAGFALQFGIDQPRAGRFVASSGPRVTIRPLRRGRSGRWIKTGASWHDIGSPHAPVGVDVRQRAALRALMASGGIDRYLMGGEAVPLGQFGPDLWYQLERAVDVGVELIGERGVTAVEISPTPAEPAVDLTADEDGAVSVAVGFASDGSSLLVDGRRGGALGAPAHGIWVVEGARLLLFPLVTPLHPALDRLAAGGGITVPADDVEELLERYQPELARHGAVGSSDGSVAIVDSELEALVLTVERTGLTTATLRWSARYRRGERTARHPLHRPGGSGRDPAAEAAALKAVELPTHLLPGLVDAHGTPQDLEVGGTDVIELLDSVVPWLRQRGEVDVELVDVHPALREAIEDPRIALTVSDGQDRAGSRDWFDLDVEVSVDGEAVDFATLFTALAQDQDALILPSGTWLRLDRPELTRLRDLIDEARALVEPGRSAVVRLNAFQASWWEELTELGVVAQQSARWAANVDRWAERSAPVPIDAPVGLGATLRPYQQEGLDWLAFLHRHQLGGILADDMGLGKTVQALALCLHVLEHAPGARFLVVAPTSVVDNWGREAAQFAPGAAVCTIQETSARRGRPLAGEIGSADIVVTSYALFRIDFDEYAAHDWELLLLDEAQFVKNHQGKTYQCARRLPAASKIAITGTPLENTLMDLWSLLSITAPGLYPDPKRFAATFRKPIEEGDAPELLTTLRRRIAPFVRRRTKEEVLTELPPKTEQTVEVDLSARHARIYQTQLQRQRQKVLGLVGDVRKHRFEILRSLTILRQLALDPALVDDAHDGIGSAKLDRLLDDLGQVVAEGHRALVFSQFTRFLGRARARLDAAGIAHSYLDGSTRDRGAAVSRFKDGDVPVFVISLKAGGFGLNLTEADYCFVLDPWWNPATETQAVDRAHRMGQQHPVMVYRYVSAGTIEEKVMELKARKAGLFTSVMDAEGALSGALTEDDIRGLLDLG